MQTAQSSELPAPGDHYVRTTKIYFFWPRLIIVLALSGALAFAFSSPRVKATINAQPAVLAGVTSQNQTGALEIRTRTPSPKFSLETEIWGFQLDQSVPMQNVQSGLRATGFSVFSGAHPGINYQGSINGSWYHIGLNSIADGELVMEHHFEVSRPSSWDHKKDYLTGRASSWQRPSKEECDRRRKNSK